MLKVEIRCHSCNSAVAKTLNYNDAVHWGWNLWKTALTNGWARRVADNTPYCSKCKVQLESASTVVLPVDPLPIVGYLQCGSCSNRFEQGKVSIGEHFVRDLRANARLAGWRFISSDGNQTYQDYCPNCEPDDLGKRRVALMKLVWSKPTSTISKEMGISDKAVEKRCRRLGVPKPSVGFWAKYHAGYISDCISLIPEIVSGTLGEEFIGEIYGLDQNRSRNELLDS